MVSLLMPFHASTFVPSSVRVATPSLTVTKPRPASNPMATSTIPCGGLKAPSVASETRCTICSAFAGPSSSRAAVPTSNRLRGPKPCPPGPCPPKPGPPQPGPPKPGPPKPGPPKPGPPKPGPPKPGPPKPGPPKPGPPKNPPDTLFSFNCEATDQLTRPLLLDLLSRYAALLVVSSNLIRVIRAFGPSSLHQLID